MVKPRLTRKLRVELGISKMIGGKEYSILDHAKTKTEIIKMKKRYVSKVYSVRVTKTKGEYPYEIWMSRRKM